MTTTYFRVWYRLNSLDAYLIWYSNDHDGVHVQSDGTTPCFADEAALSAYAAAQQISVSEEPPTCRNLDVIMSWIEHPSVATVGCAQFLAAWNLFSDISASVNGTFDADQAHTQQVYEKLFGGNNLPSVTPWGCTYTPTWNDDELLVMRDTLADGLALFHTSVRAFHT